MELQARRQLIVDQLEANFTRKRVILRKPVFSFLYFSTHQDVASELMSPCHQLRAKRAQAPMASKASRATNVRSRRGKTPAKDTGTSTAGTNISRSTTEAVTICRAPERPPN